MPMLMKISDVRIVAIDDLKIYSCLSFDIGTLLALIHEEGPSLAWSIFPMGEGTDITGDFSSLGLTYQEFCVRVNSSERGMLVSWQELQAISNLVHQTIWGTYIGCQSADAFSRLNALYSDEWGYLDRASPEYYESVEIAFQAIDSSFWLVYVKDDALANRIRTAFCSVETLNCG